MRNLDEGGSAPTTTSAWRIAGRALVAAVIVLLVAELFVRLAVNGPSPQRFDPVFGYTYIANADQFNAREGFARIQLNELGLNDRPVGPKNDRWRVLVVGDSYTASIQVPTESNFTSVAEDLDSRLDVVNAGRDGLFLGNLGEYARRFAQPLDADMIVYVISEGDVDDDIRRPEFRVRFNPRDGTIVSTEIRVDDRELLKQRIEVLTHHSALVTRMIGQLRPAVAQATDLYKKLTRPFGQQPQRQRVEPRPDMVTPSHVDILRYVFRQLRQDRNKPVAILYINGLKYHADGRAEVEPSSLDAEERARAAAQAIGIPFYVAATELKKVYSETGAPPFGFNNGIRLGGHLNERGHAAIGAVLRDLAVEQLGLEGATASR